MWGHVCSICAPGGNHGMVHQQSLNIHYLVVVGDTTLVSHYWLKMETDRSCRTNKWLSGFHPHSPEMDPHTLQVVSAFLSGQYYFCWLEKNTHKVIWTQHLVPTRWSGPSKRYIYIHIDPHLDNQLKPGTTVWHEWAIQPLPASRYQKTKYLVPSPTEQPRYTHAPSDTHLERSVGSQS